MELDVWVEIRKELEEQKLWHIVWKKNIFSLKKNSFPSYIHWETEIQRS